LQVLIEADDAETQWRRHLRALDEDCHTPSDVYNALDALAKLPPITMPSNSASTLDGGHRDLVKQASCLRRRRLKSSP
jgi:hypothetical protein